jgi:predicted nucleic acid-binding protein
MKILIDTSVFIEFSRTNGGQYVELLSLAEKSKVLLSTSVIVLAEYWSGKSMKDNTHLLVAKKLFADIESYQINERIAKRGGEIRREYRLDLPDALIAATALEYDAHLATLNEKHFAGIPGLKLWRG